MKASAKKLRLAQILFCAGLILARAHAQSTCVNFPAGFIPFSSISYVTAADSAGDHLVVGVPAPGALSLINAGIPAPAFTNQTFCDAQVQLAPQQLYPNVYVPTAAELSGNFSAFSGLLVNPATNVAYPNGTIPTAQLANVFAWRIGPAQVTLSDAGWSPTGSMTEPRAQHAAVLLPSGKVLVVGGDPTADLYDPATGSFAPTGQMLFAHGGNLTATLLSDGRVLVVGGGSAPSAAELYDPVTGRFVATGVPVQPHGLFSSATLLNDGRVLIVGGNATPGFAGGPNSGAEVYNPQTGAFAAAGAMAFNRNSHTATLLANGRVLVAGGTSLGAGADDGSFTVFNSAEIYDPSIGSFSLTFPMAVSRSLHFAVPLASGQVLVGGGGHGGGPSAELFNPASGAFTPTGNLSVLGNAASANSLSDGQVLVGGGELGPGTGTNSAELYNPSTGSFTATGSMGTSRNRHTGTLLLDGRVLVTGGDAVCCGPPLSSAERYTPVSEGLVSSQTGLTFRVAAGNTSVPTQTVAVLSNTATIPWTLSTHTYQGGSWLSVTPTTGNSVPGAAPTTLTITVNPSGLATQDYYGAVILTPTDGVHPPVTIAIVLHIVPPGTAAPPVVTPSGLLFLGTPGATLKPQSFAISNLTSATLSFNAVASTSPSWFTFTPASATIAAAQTTSITVSATLGSMTAGVYPASIKLLFGDGSTQTVALLLVISATAGSARPRPTRTYRAQTLSSRAKRGISGHSAPRRRASSQAHTPSSRTMQRRNRSQLRHTRQPRAPHRSCCRFSPPSEPASTHPPRGRHRSSSRSSTIAATRSTPDR